MSYLEEVSYGRIGAETSLTAAGAGDNTVVTGAIHDRGAYQYPQSMGLVFSFTATLAAGKNLFLKSVVIEHGDDSGLSDAATFKTFEDATGHSVAYSAAGGTVTGCKDYFAALVGCKRYVRVKYTPDLDATATDTAKVIAVATFADEYNSPAI